MAMSESTARLRNLLADELGQCCEADVTERVDELEDVGDRAALADVEGDLRALSALASETRYRIVRLLAAAERELCVCEIEPLVDVSASAVSHGLSNLSDAGLIDRRKEGRWRYYRPTDRGEALLAALDETRGGAAAGARTAAEDDA